jgi:ribonuclease E
MGPVEGAEGSGAEPARRRRRRRGGRGRGQDAAQAEGLQGEETPSGSGDEELPEAAAEQAPEPVSEPAREPAVVGTQPEPQAAAPMPVASSDAAEPGFVMPAAQAELPLAPVAQVAPAMAAEAPRPVAVTQASLEPASAPEAPEAPAAQQPADASTTAAEALPVEQLRAIVETAGLQWVQSNPERVEQARRKARQAPAQRHAPRERKPRATQDEGPLVLVETRKALPRLDLPENEQPTP